MHHQCLIPFFIFENQFFKYIYKNIDLNFIVIIPGITNIFYIAINMFYPSIFAQSSIVTYIFPDIKKIKKLLFRI